MACCVFLNVIYDGLQRKPHIEREIPSSFAFCCAFNQYRVAQVFNQVLRVCVYYANSVDRPGAVRSETQVDCVAYIQLNYSVPTYVVIIFGVQYL